MRSAAAETRPWIASGVRVWSAVEKATIAQAMPTPAIGAAVKHHAERRHDQAEVGDGEDRQSDADQADLTEASQHRGRGHSAGDRADPLERGEDSEEGRLLSDRGR